MNSSALIGYTGFVGSNLSRQLDFDAYYNSSNIAEIRGREFDFVVIAAVQAKKWWANQHPDKDWSMIELLLTELATMVARQIVLISTVDVLPPIAGADESFDPHGHANHTYGQNRLHFEDAVRRLHETVTIIRLPGLFGPGLRKNIIYDLLNNNQVEKINPGSRFQYYDLSRLSFDIKKTLDADIDLVHLFTEPVVTADILERFFPVTQVGKDPVPEVHYDYRTRHAPLFGGSGRYIYNRDEVLRRLEQFIQNYRRETR